MRRLLELTMAAIAALAVAGCATMSVGSHVERGLDVAQYRTYDWGPADALPTGDARLDKNPFFQDRVQGAVEKELAARGFAWSASGTPDLLIHYHANISERIDIDRMDREYGYCYPGGCTPSLIRYEAGTLVLDIIDTRTNRLIWRGWAQDSVKEMLDNQDTMARQINEGVTRMFTRFPRPL
ncbi:MAG: DUF4136 domain-containing protein [Acidobacteria bacterium]|nr:DUF4136 domain-containing protein [Acidobacteriota bacterium]